MASDGTVRSLGKCLEVNGDQVVDGARVQRAADVVDAGLNSVDAFGFRS